MMVNTISKLTFWQKPNMKGWSMRIFFPLGRGLFTCREVGKWRKRRSILGPNLENIKVVPKIGSKTKIWDVGCDGWSLPSILTYFWFNLIHFSINGRRRFGGVGLNRLSLPSGMNIDSPTQPLVDGAALACNNSQGCSSRVRPHVTSCFCPADSSATCRCV